MAALRLCWKSEVRAGWRTVVVLCLVVGIGGGTALTALSGARRADTSMPRFVHYSRPGTATVFFGDSLSPPPVAGAAARSTAPPPYARAVLALPQVEAYYRVLYVFSATNGDPAGVVNTFGLVDPTAATVIDRPLVLNGHLPDPASPVQVSVNELAATKLHLHVGSLVRVQVYSAAQLASGSLSGAVGAAPPAPDGPRYSLRVTAIVRFVTDVNAIVPLAAKQNADYEGQQDMFLTPAFVARFAEDIGVPVQRMTGMNAFGLHLRGGAHGWRSFVSEAKKLAGRSGVPISFQQGDSLGIPTAAKSAERGIGVETFALLLFGILAAVVTVLLVGQAVARRVLAGRDDRTTMRSLGATRSQLIFASLTSPALIAVSGGGLAVIGAALASPLMPIGLARKAEIHPGFAFNAAILLGGGALLAATLLLYASLVAVIATRRDSASVAYAPTAAASARRGGLARGWRAGAGPLPAVVGIRLATGAGSSRRAGPIVIALVGAVAAVVGLTAALTFARSLDHLVGTPSQQGWNWDLLVGNPNDSDDNVISGGALLTADHEVAAYAAVGELGAVQVDGVDVPQVLAFDQLKGSVHPPLLNGRAPAGPHEIAFGTRSLHQLHKRVGQAVTIAAPDGRRYRFRIVGTMVAPSVGDLLTNSLGEGGWVDASFVHQEWRSPSNPSGTPPPGTDVLNIFAVKLAPGVTTAQGVARLQRDFGPTVLQQLPAEDAVNLKSVSGLPFALAGLIALLGVATVGNAVVGTVRQRRRDLAVLKVIGFVRRQVSSVVAWQATAFAAAALLLGVPLGLALGRWAWNQVASSIDSVSPTVVPVTAVLLIIPATIAVCNAVAAWPARSAGRLRPALAMRHE